MDIIDCHQRHGAGLEPHAVGCGRDHEDRHLLGCGCHGYDLHVLCRTGSWKKEINGLGNLVGQHGYGSRCGLDRLRRTSGTVRGVDAAGGAPFDEDTGQQMIDKVATSPVTRSSS
jgi:hypothetical protein